MNHIEPNLPIGAVNLSIEAVRQRIQESRGNPRPLTGRLDRLVRRHNWSRAAGKSVSKVVVQDGRLVDIRDTGEYVTVSKITTEVFS